jgi:alcohol dehydrogenase (cytochrome c)
MALRLPGAILLVVALASLPAAAQVTYERLLRAAQEPQNWLTYSGGYSSHRYSPLARITPANVANLEQKWVLQASVVGTWQATPVVVDGVMYVTQRPNDVMALDARTGRPYWL